MLLLLLLLNNNNNILYGGRLIALQKKDGGIRPIAVGYTLRRLAAKCANKFVIKRTSEELQPIQVGVVVSEGAEASVHATRRLLSNLQDNHVFVKLDFSNTFNSVRRDTILTTVADKIPKLYRFVHDSLDCNPKLVSKLISTLVYGDNVIISAEGSQQGDHLSRLELCESVQPIQLERERHKPP